MESKGRPRLTKGEDRIAREKERGRGRVVDIDDPDCLTHKSQKKRVGIFHTFSESEKKR